MTSLAYDHTAFRRVAKAFNADFSGLHLHGTWVLIDSV